MIKKYLLTDVLFVNMECKHWKCTHLQCDANLNEKVEMYREIHTQFLKIKVQNSPKTQIFQENKLPKFLNFPTLM